MDLKSLVKIYENFPKNGVKFIDILPLFANTESLYTIIDKIYAKFWDHKIQKVVGIEARAFILGGLIACDLSCGFIPIRKKGKLPEVAISKECKKEYGSSILEIPKDFLKSGEKVLIFDDILASGNTLLGAIQMLNELDIKDIEVCVLGEIESLKGRELINKDYPNIPIYSIIKF